MALCAEIKVHGPDVLTLKIYLAHYHLSLPQLPHPNLPLCTMFTSSSNFAYEFQGFTFFPPFYWLPLSFQYSPSPEYYSLFCIFIAPTPNGTHLFLFFVISLCQLRNCLSTPFFVMLTLGLGNHHAAPR